MLYDPIEDDPDVAKRIRAAEQRAKRELEADGVVMHMGYCYSLWLTQQRILKEKYGIDWKTPAEMNPDTIFH